MAWVKENKISEAKGTKKGGISVPPELWTKCPHCHELMYAKEVALKNKCPNEACGYVYPYPVAKAQQVEAFLRSGKKRTCGDVDRLVLELLSTIPDPDQKAAFIAKAYILLTIDWPAWYRFKQGQKERMAEYRKAFKALDNNPELQSMA